MHGTDWMYHHDLPTINRLAFLYTYLQDVVPGASMYAGWVNGDVYQQTSEQFCVVPLPG
jgi:hypothetical protein